MTQTAQFAMLNKLAVIHISCFGASFSWFSQRFSTNIFPALAGWEKG
jgi:hypothetical protein